MPVYFLAVYIIFVLTSILFTLQIKIKDAATGLITFASLLFYPFLQLLFPAVIAVFTGFLLRKVNKLRIVAVGVVTVFFVYLIHLFLLLDAGLYFRYGYHINPHVINIFTTPGGFEGMGNASQ